MTHYGQTLAEVERLQDAVPMSDDDDDAATLPSDLNFGGTKLYYVPGYRLIWNSQNIRIWPTFSGIDFGNEISEPSRLHGREIFQF